jgi:molybdopterin converting factor small subunit
VAETLNGVRWFGGRWFGRASILEPRTSNRQANIERFVVVPQARSGLQPVQRVGGPAHAHPSWEDRITLREIWERLAADHPRLRANLPRQGIQEEVMSHLVAVIVDGDILTLDAEIKDGAKVDVLTPLSGGK